MSDKCDFCDKEKETAPLETNKGKKNICIDCYRSWERWINMVPTKIPAM